MVQLLSYLSLFTLIIAPTFASPLRDLETRDLSEPELFERELNEAEAAVFAREMEGLFARQQGNTEYIDLARRGHFSAGSILKGAFNLLLGRELDSRDLSEPELFERELNEAEATVFAREMEGLSARQQGNTEYIDLARRGHFSAGSILKGAFNLLLGRELDSDHTPHSPPMRHELHETPDGNNVRRSFDEYLVERDVNDEILERNLDDELYGRDLTEADLFERGDYDDLD